MRSSPFAFFTCALLSSISGRDSVLCSLSGNSHSSLASRSLAYLPNYPANESSSSASHFHTSVSPVPPDRAALLSNGNRSNGAAKKHPPTNDFSRLNRHSRYSTEHMLDDRLNKKFTPPLHHQTRVPLSSARTSISDLNQIFHKVYESNYAHFCACPPELSKARHSLEGAEDRTITECIYLPLTTVHYRCISGYMARKQGSQVVDRLVCDLNPSTNRLDWIVDTDDKLFDLDDLPVYRYQLTVGRSGRNETMEIRAQSVQLSDFSVEFLQCNDRKLSLFGF